MNSISLFKDLICSTKSIESLTITQINNIEYFSNAKIKYNDIYDIPYISFEYKDKFKIDVHKNIFNYDDNNLIIIIKNGFCGYENINFLLANLKSITYINYILDI
jgi:hypothetical protein|tara:strand:+ start:734 stop:1048 length:315 start_codon:yes stop_codon:yes gene_type:complete